MRLVIFLFFSLGVISITQSQYCDLLDFNEGPNGSNPESLTPFNESLIFVAEGTNGSHELWMTDGTMEGSIKIFNTSDEINSNKFGLLKGNDQILFFEVLTKYGSSLYKTNGSKEGTFKLHSFLKPVGSFHFFKEKFYFSATDHGSNAELWVTDGTVEGTHIHKEINIGERGSFPRRFHQLSQDAFLFYATDSHHGTEMWVSDGTIEGTQVLFDATPGPLGGVYYDIINFQGKAFYTLQTETYGSELWQTDGTPSGTSLVKDINPGTKNSYAQNLTIVNDRLVYFASDDIHGYELRYYNPLTKEEDVLKDIYPGRFFTHSNNLKSISSNGDLAVFFALSPDYGLEPWVTDGTPEGTTLLRDLNKGTKGVYEIGVAENNGIFYSSVFTDDYGWELLVTDGTPSKTRILDIVEGPDGSFPFNANFISDLIVFLTDILEQNGPQPWVTKGTKESTNQLCTINSSNDLFSIVTRVVGEKIFFASDDGIHGKEIFVFDLRSNSMNINVIPSTSTWMALLLALSLIILAATCVKNKELESLF